MVINRSVIRNMNNNKMRYIGLILLIALSTMLYISFGFATDAIQKGTDCFFEDGKVDDGEFILTNRISEEELKKYEEKYGITIEEQLYYDYDLNDKVVLRIHEANKKLNFQTVLRGSDIKDKNDILLSYDFAKANNYQINDKLLINEKEYNIAGLFTEPDYLYPLKAETDVSVNNKTFGLVIAGKQLIDTLKEPVANYCVAGGDKNVYSDLRKDIKKDNYILKWLPKEQNQRIININSTVQSLTAAGDVIPISVLIIVCILVTVLLRRQLKVEYKQIGLLRAFGYSLREIELHYLRYSLYLAIIGTLLGIIPGILLARPISMLMNLKYAMPEIDIPIRTNTLLINILLTFTFLLLSTFFVIKKSLKLTTLELMRGKSKKNKIGSLERKINIGRFKFDTRFKIRGFLRNISRSVTIFLGIMISSVLLMFGFSLNDSFEYLVDDCVKNETLYNYEYYMQSFSDKDVKNAEKMSFAQVETEDGVGFMIYGIKNNAKLINLKNENGQTIDLNKTIVSRPLANELNIKGSQTLKVYDVTDQREYEIVVDAVASNNIGNYIYMPLDKLNEMFGYPENSYLKLISSEKLDIPDEDIQIENDLENIMLGYDSMMKPLRLLTGVMAIVTFLIGIIIIYLLTSLIIEENSYDISLLKIFGYKEGHIFNLIINGMVMIISIAYVAGCLVSVPVMDKMLNIMSADLGVIIPVKINMISIIIGYVVIMFTYFVTKKIVQRKVNKVSFVDVLKYRNE